MLSKLFRRLSSGLLGNIGANLCAQLVQLAIQFAAVPIMSTRWGLAGYGTWIVLFTIPSYLAMADLGFTSAAANDMTIDAARGHLKEARTTFFSLRLMMWMIGPALLSVAALMLYVVLPHSLDFAEAASGGHARFAALLLTGYGIVSLQNGVTLAGFRASDGYARSGYAFVAIMFTEAAAALSTVWFGGDICDAALAYVATRIVGSALLALWLSQHAPWLTRGDRGRALPRLRALVQPAVAVMAVPAAQALSLQGTVLVVGAAAGLAMVPVFTTVRTLTRTAVQITTIVNHASMPAYTVASALDDHSRKAALVRLGMMTSGVVLLPACVLLLLFGQQFIQFWTRGAVAAPFPLILVMSVVMVLYGLWLPVSNLILSINQHAGFSYHYLAFAALSVALCYPLTLYFWPVGTGMAMALLESLMLWRVLRLARAIGVFDGGIADFRHPTRVLFDRLRRTTAPGV